MVPGAPKHYPPMVTSRPFAFVLLSWTRTNNPLLWQLHLTASSPGLLHDNRICSPGLDLLSELPFSQSQDTFDVCRMREYSIDYPRADQARLAYVSFLLVASLWIPSKPLVFGLRSHSIFTAHPFSFASLSVSTFIRGPAWKVACIFRVDVLGAFSYVCTRQPRYIETPRVIPPQESAGSSSE